MSPEAFHGFKPTNLNLGPRPVEKAERVTNDKSPEQFQKYTPQDMKNFDSRVINRLPPWAEDLNHPVYKDLPEDMTALMDKVAQAPTTNTEDVSTLVKALNNRWDVWIDTQP